jgi:hypothetical protein
MDSTDEPEPPRLRDRPGIRDALYGALFMFPAAALVAVVYRFPVPMGGTVSGPSGAWDAMLATIFFGLAGGFLVVPAVAAALGTLLRRNTGDRPALVPLPAAAAALLFAMGLAALA